VTILTGNMTSPARTTTKRQGQQLRDRHKATKRQAQKRDQLRDRHKISASRKI
jgi:hypothetical protein